MREWSLFSKSRRFQCSCLMLAVIHVRKESFQCCECLMGAKPSLDMSGGGSQKKTEELAIEPHIL